MTLSYRLALAFAIAVTTAWSGAVVAEPRTLTDQAKQKVSHAADSVIDGAQNLALYALGLIGVRYRWGGEDPDSGLDCSGLVRHVFQQVTGVPLPRTAKEMSRLGDRVAKHQLEPGDLVFFNTRRFAFSHVGIYLGDNRFIHAPRKGREVEIADFGNRYWQKTFNGARRVSSAMPAFLAPIIPTAAAAPIGPNAGLTPAPASIAAIAAIAPIGATAGGAAVEATNDAQPLD